MLEKPKKPKLTECETDFVIVLLPKMEFGAWHMLGTCQSPKQQHWSGGYLQTEVISNACSPEHLPQLQGFCQRSGPGNLQFFLMVPRCFCNCRDSGSL